jgi:hypothetical protein
MSRLMWAEMEGNMCGVPLVRAIIVIDILDRIREEKTECGDGLGGLVCFGTVGSKAVKIHALRTEPDQSASYCLSFRQ